MTDLHIPDISKWQGDVDLSKVGPAVILRAHSGRGVDPTLAQRQPLARQHCQVVGYYGYVVPDRDPRAQAREMAAAVGMLRAGEFCAVDVEEGTGDESDRALAYAAELDRLCGGKAWIYSGLAFYKAHLARVTGRRVWIAAYSSTEPTLAHTLWQHTDREQHPGIGPCDCSIFHGTVQQLRDLISPPAPAPSPHVNPQPAPSPAPPAPPTTEENEMALIVKDPNSNAQWVVATDLTSKAPIQTAADLAALQKTPGYHVTVLTAAQLNRIPTVSA